MIKKMEALQSILKFTYFDTGNTCRSHILMSTPCHALFVCTIQGVTLKVA